MATKNKGSSKKNKEEQKEYYYGWMVELNLAYRLEKGIRFELNEPSLPFELSDLKELDGKAAVQAVWPDEHTAAIPEMTNQKMIGLLQNMRTTHGAESTPLLILERKIGHHKVIIEQRVDRGLLVSVYEQDRQVLQIRPDRWHHEVMITRVPNEHKAVQEALAYLKPIVQDYCDGKIKTAGLMKKKRNLKLKNEQLPAAKRLPTEMIKKKARRSTTE